MSVFDSSMAYTASLILSALILELSLGWPSALFKRIRHPVVWIGALVSILETHFNRASSSEKWRELSGMFSTLTVVFVSTALAWALSTTLPNNLIGLVFEAFVRRFFLFEEFKVDSIYLPGLFSFFKTEK